MTPHEGAADVARRILAELADGWMSIEAADAALIAAEEAFHAAEYARNEADDLEGASGVFARAAAMAAAMADGRRPTDFREVKAALSEIATWGDP